jgi:hypothetical protein
MGLLLVCVGIAAYGAYVLHGGFYSDDWANAAGYRLADSQHYWSNVQDLHRILGGRPILALLLPVPHALFGLHPSLHLGLALGIGIATSLCYYLFLRTLSMAALHAGAISVLVLLFPWSDAIRLWSTASLNALSVCFFLLGAVLALRGLKRHGGSAIAMHAGAVVLYVLSVLTYEVAAAAALLVGFLYLGRAPVAAAARRWLIDILAVSGALVYSLTSTVTTRHVGSLGQRIDDLRRFVRESVRLFSSALVPAHTWGTAIAVVLLLAVGGVVTVAILQLRRAPRPQLRYWLSVSGIAAVGIAAAYFMFLGSYLYPLNPGTGTRANVFAALGWCTLIYAVVALGAELVAGARPWASKLALVTIAVIAVGYGIRVHDDESAWRRASTLQHGLLATVDPKLQRLPRRATLFTFNYPAEVSLGIPIFDRSWDLNGAVQLAADDQAVHAYPVYRGVVVHCGRRGVTVNGPGSYGTKPGGYGRAVFFNVPSGEEQPIRGPRGCARAVHRFPEGQLTLGTG